MTEAILKADCAVVGTGPAGLAAALAMAWHGLDAILIGPLPTPEALARETRTTALFGGSVQLLRNLEAWDDLTEAAPLRALRIIDDTGNLVRAPEMLFSAAEVGRDSFGYNIENVHLIKALQDRVAASQRIRRVPCPATGLSFRSDTIVVSSDDGPTVEAALVVAADGRQSICRAAAGVATEAWAYPQEAIATRFRHRRPHGGVSTELHRRHGPLTTVPLNGDRSSLVWVESPVEAARLVALPADRFASELEHSLGSLLGAITDIGPRSRFPLAGLTAKPLARCRVALVGEAGHVLPPIGAQGLNLGFRDAAWIAEIAGAAKAEGRDLGSDAVLARYTAARASDVATRVMAVDLINRSLLAGMLPVDVARGAGLAVLATVPWLRRLVMREGIEPSGRLPQLLRAANDAPHDESGAERSPR